MNLRDLRKQAGLSVKEVANKLNITPNALYNYENGYRGIPMFTAIVMAQVYGVSLEELAEALPDIVNTRR